MQPIRVIVVDDSSLVRALLAGIIDRQSDMRCVGSAADPLAARELIRALDPDVVTLDIEMPRMDGLDFLERLMRLRPTPVVMISTLTERGTEATLKALALGAVDFVAKPKGGGAEDMRLLADEITAKIRVAAQARVQRLPAVAAVTPHVDALGRPCDVQAVFVGASTGGTEATRQLLAQLPSDCPPLLIVQHMPAGYTRCYAARLDAASPLGVAEAGDGEPLRAGRAYVAPGGRHLWVERDAAGLVSRLGDGAPVNRHRPSVDVLFASAARVLGRRALGVMLTGMGSDGARAMRAMRDAGAYNICQDEATSVVFGMPRAAIALDAAHEVLPLGTIAPRLLDRLRCALRPAQPGAWPGAAG